MRSYFILSICLIFLLRYFIPVDALLYVLALFTLAAFAGSVTLAKRLPQFFSVLMLLAGTVLTFAKGDGIKEAALGITTNIPLLTLLVLVPLLSIPFKLGGFFDSIQTYLKRLRNSPRKMFAGISGVIFLLGPILNLGSIRFIHDLVKDMRLHARLLTKAYMIGFATTILWSPYYAAVGITLLYLHVSIGSYMAYGIGLAILFLVIGNVLFGFSARKLTAEPDELSLSEPDAATAAIHRQKLKTLPLLILSLMAVTIVAEMLTGWSMLVLVSLLALVFPLLWVALSKQWSAFKDHLIDYRDKSVPVMNNETIMYISAGFFGQALRGTTFGEGINRFMTDIAQVSFLLFALFILLTMVTVTFIGIHQVVTVTVLATQMDPAMLGTTKEILAMVIMLSWMASSILSPVNPINLLVGTMTKRSSIEIGIKDNGVFVLVVCAVGLAILTYFH